MDYHPPLTMLGKNICGFNLCFVNSTVNYRTQTFCAHDPSPVAIYMNRRLCDRELHDHCVVKNPSPALYHFVSTLNERPTRVDTSNFILIVPDSTHLVYIQGFKSSIKQLIG